MSLGEIIVELPRDNLHEESKDDFVPIPTCSSDDDSFDSYKDDFINDEDADVIEDETGRKPSATKSKA